MVYQYRAFLQGPVATIGMVCTSSVGGLHEPRAREVTSVGGVEHHTLYRGAVDRHAILEGTIVEGAVIAVCNLIQVGPTAPEE